MKTLEQLEAEIRTVFTRMATLDGVLLGNLLEKHNRERRKDGSIYVSPPYYTFQYQGQNGRQQWRRVPRQHKARVEQMIGNGQEYVRLRKSVETLLCDAALIGLDSKKNDC